MEQTIGIDVSKATFDLAVVSESKTEQESFRNDEEGFEALEQWLEDRSIDEGRMCMEATGTYGLKLAARLIDGGHELSVVNPARVQAYAESELCRNKTDRSDARLLARFCDAHDPQMWQPTDEKWARLQELVRRIQSLKQTRTQEKNRVQKPKIGDEVTDSLNAHIDYLDSAIEKLWAEIDRLVDNCSEASRAVELVESIPGIGRRTAIQLVAEIRDIDRFDSAKKLAGHTGIPPQNVESGSSRDDPASMSKKGPARLRGLLWMPAMSARRWNPIVREFCDRLEEKGKHSRTIMGAAMHKLIRLVYGVWNNDEPFDPEYEA
ncbi:MAG: IS110 family transposase [Bradymonadaceae bacterium]